MDVGAAVQAARPSESNPRRGCLRVITIDSQSFLLSRRAGAPNGRPYILRTLGCGEGAVWHCTFEQKDVGAAVRAARPSATKPHLRGGGGVVDSQLRRSATLCVGCAASPALPAVVAGFNTMSPLRGSQLPVLTIVPIVFVVAEGGRPERAPLHFADVDLRGGFVAEGGRPCVLRVWEGVACYSNLFVNLQG